MTLLVGGLGWPHDELVVAALRAQGLDAIGLGVMDVEAYELGRASLPRGQCAPMLYTTGALLRAAEERREKPLSFLSVQSCGPCRYALFAPGWLRALRGAGHGSMEVVELGQTSESLHAWLRDASRAIEVIAVADAVAEQAHRLRPHEARAGRVDDAAREATTRMARRIEAGEEPLRVLEHEHRWHEGTWKVRDEPLARAVVIGEPWSLHVHGDGRLWLPAVLARAGVEVEIPPVGTWLAYLLWQARTEPWGGGAHPDRAALTRVREAETQLHDMYARTEDVTAMSGLVPPEMDEVAELAAPYLSPLLRGGYGHIEVGLAARARHERRGHFVLSVKSFGCIPSSGVSDAIVPTALGMGADRIPHLALEVCTDGASSRESRLAMRVAEAHERCRGEVADARGTFDAIDPVLNPLRPARGEYASSLANEFARRARGRAP